MSFISKIVLLTVLSSVSVERALCGEIAGHTIEVVNRHLYGPGPFPDQTLKTAWIRKLVLTNGLDGTVKGENNGGDEPNVTGEALQGKKVDGLLSDGTAISESIDMSNAVIMNGQFNLLLVAAFGGPNNGDTHFHLDQDQHWWIKDDIAIDPGFPEGVIKINDFTFSTKPRLIPVSIQTEKGYPGGTNRIGSLEAGRAAQGRLGDGDNDGYLDGTFNAIGRFPMESIFLPGAPFVQLFEFKSDIRISAETAAALSISSAMAQLKLVDELRKIKTDHPDITIARDAARKSINEAKRHLERLAVIMGPCDTLCRSSQQMLQSSVFLPAGKLDRDEVSNVLKEVRSWAGAS